MPTDVGVLKVLLDAFVHTFAMGFRHILPDALWLLQAFLILELAMIGLMVAFEKEDVWSAAFMHLLKFGFFIFLVLHWPALIEIVRDSFVRVGLVAGGGGLNVAQFTNPSAIAAYGVQAASPIFQHIAGYGMISAAKNVGDLLVTGLSGLMIVLAFFVIAIQIFITILEFYLTSVIGLILLPFGVNRHTAFLAERVMSSAIAFGLKLGVLALVTSATMPLLMRLHLPPDPNFNQIFGMLLASLAIAGLAWHAPGLAAGLLSGSPALSAATAVGTTVAAVGVGAAGTMAAAAMSTQGVRLGAMGMQRAAAVGAGVKTAALLGSSTAVGGPAAQLGGAMQGIGKYATSSITTSAIASRFSAAIARGRVQGFVHTGGTVPQGSKVPPQSSGRAAVAQRGGVGMGKQMMTAASIARRMIPREARPGGGLHM